MFYVMSEHVVQQVCTYWLKSRCFRCQTKGYFCLEPTPDLEEETSVCAKLTRVGSTVCVLKKVTFSRSGAG